MSHRNSYWSILKKFWMCIRFTALLHPGRDQYWLMSKWSSGQKQKYGFSQIPYSVWWRMTNSKDAIKKNSKCLFLTQNCWESWEKQLNSSGIFPRIFIIADSSRDPAWFERGTLNPKRFTDRIIFMSMFNDIDWTRKEMMEFVFRIRKRSRNTGRNSRKDTERFWVLDTTRSGMELFLTHLKKWDSTATQMVERFKDTGHPLFKRKSTQIVKVLDTYGLEIAIPSPNDSTRAFHVMISRGKSPFVDELHIPNVEHGTSAELLSEQKAKESEPCLAQSKTGIQVTGAAYVTSQTSIQETGAATPSISPSQASFYPQKTIPTTERKWFLRQRLASTCSSRMQQDEVLVLWEFQNSLASFRAIQGHSGGVTINPELTGTFWFLTTGRSISFTGVVLSAPNLSWWTDWFPVERKATKDGRLSSSHHWTFLVEILKKKNPVMITQFLKRCTVTVIWRIAIWANRVARDHLERSCASRVHLQSNLSKRRSNIVRKTLNPTTSAQSHIEKSLAIATAAAVDLSWCDKTHDGGGEGEPVWDKRRQRLYNRRSNQYKGDFYEVLNQLLRQSQNSKLIFE